MTLHPAWRAPETATWSGIRMVWVLREGAKTAQLHLAATIKDMQEPGVIAWQPIQRPQIQASSNGRTADFDSANCGSSPHA